MIALLYGTLWLAGALVVLAALAMWFFFQMLVWATALAIVLAQWAIQRHRFRPLPRAPRVPRGIPQARWSDRR